MLISQLQKSNQQQLKTILDNPNLLLLVSHFSQLLQDEEAGCMLHYIMQKIYLKRKQLWKVLKCLLF